MIDQAVRCLTWDGVCEDGQPAASGVYLLRLRAGDWQATRKLTLIR